MANDPLAPPEQSGHLQLVRLAQHGDRAAFGALYRDFARVVHGILLACCGHADVEDLVQEVFMQAFQRLPELRDAAAFPGWLCTSARHAGIDHRRAKQRTAAVPMSEIADPAGRGPSPAESLAMRDAAARALSCICRLSDTYRETLVLRLVEGLTGPEIAARTGMTHGSVRVNLTRGMALLRPLLQEAGLP